jgi:hypothetical protein
MIIVTLVVYCCGVLLALLPFPGEEVLREGTGVASTGTDLQEIYVAFWKGIGLYYKFSDFDRMHKH